MTTKALIHTIKAAVQDKLIAPDTAIKFAEDLLDAAMSREIEASEAYTPQGELKLLRQCKLLGDLSVAIDEAVTSDL